MTPSMFLSQIASTPTSITLLISASSFFLFSSTAIVSSLLAPPEVSRKIGRGSPAVLPIHFLQPRFPAHFASFLLRTGVVPIAESCRRLARQGQMNDRTAQPARRHPRFC